MHYLDYLFVYDSWSAFLRAPYHSRQEPDNQKKTFSKGIQNSTPPPKKNKNKHLSFEAMKGLI